MLQGRVTVLQLSVTVCYKEVREIEKKRDRVNSLLLSVTRKVTTTKSYHRRIDERVSPCLKEDQD